MKLLITTGIFPPDIGGPATYVPVMAEALTARGLRVSVLTLSPPETRSEDKYPFVVIRIPRLPAGLRRTAYLIARIAAVVHQHDLVFAPGLPVESAVAALLARRPYVVKIVGDLAWERAVVQGRITDDLETFQTRWYSPRIELHRMALRWATRRAARVVVPSMYLRRIVGGWGAASERLEVIPNVPPPVTGDGTGGISQHRAEFGSRDRFRVMTVARLVPWKGIDQVIRGVATREGMELIVVGDGPDRSHLESVAAATRCPARFLGQVSRAEVLMLLRTADVLVLNSAYEGHPHVVLEAMALGVPVIARAAGGTPEVIRHRETGLLLRSGDPAEIADVLSLLRRDPELRVQLGQSGQGWVQSLTLDDIAERTYRVLVEAVAGSSRHDPQEAGEGNRRGSGRPDRSGASGRGSGW